MKTLAKYNACNHCVIGEKTFKNILIGPGKLPGLSRNGPQVILQRGEYSREFVGFLFCEILFSLQR